MTTKVKIEIRSNEGYSAKQIGHNTITVGELRNLLEDYDDDAEIVTYDLNNERGASWGTILADQWPEEIADDDEEE